MAKTKRKTKTRAPFVGRYQIGTTGSVAGARITITGLGDERLLLTANQAADLMQGLAWALSGVVYDASGGAR